MMIAIVILGLGLIMTATMFPVAWTRARSLTEYTTQRSIAASVEAAMSLRLQASGPSQRVVTVAGQTTSLRLLAAGAIAGDFFFDPTLAKYGEAAIVAYSDNLVHALNLPNLRPFSNADPAAHLVDEDPWRIERMFDIESTAFHPIFGSGFELMPAVDFIPNSFYTARTTFEQRFSPPLEPRPTLAGSALDAWRERFSARRYAWGALHRLRNPVGPRKPNLPGTLAPAQLAVAADASGTTRVVDLYVATLRRPQPTSRYAAQDATSAPNSPVAANPAERDRTVVATPRALDAPSDVLLPVPWRVQIELPRSLNFRNPPAGSGASASGIPTEVQVPPSGLQGAEAVKTSLARMFPAGAFFVDELTGQVYRVTKRREGATGLAFLTLDREILFEDVDDGEFTNNPPLLDNDEFVRVVWVYPPPVDRSVGGDPLHPVFDDASPVIGIDVRTISLSPPG